MEQIVTDYLKYLKVPVSERYCKKRIASHPDYPSILAVADTLQKFSITHTVARANKENLSELPAAYRVKDLVALIPGLADAFGNQNGINKTKISSGNAKNV